MSANLLIGITSILVFGIGAQWLAWKTKLPAILLLLISGILAGPVFNLLDPDLLMGDLLTPFISVSVAIILFEGGLSLRFSELKDVGSVIGKLVTVGVVITWVISGFAAYYIFDFGMELSILLGAILVVTGPTVIIPLLRQVRPSGQVGSILKWEGIVIDPIGAMLAVLVFEVILSTSFSAATSVAIMSIVKTIFFGTIVGLAGAALIYFLLKRHLLPDYLQNPVNLMVVVAVFTISHMLQHESGLWATTLMGIALANQKTARINHIVEFKENLRVLLLSALFILLAARVELSNLLASLNWGIVLFLVILIVIARPLSVYISTLFSEVNWREKLFLSWMAPRGVVAASISSIFAIQLAANGFEKANQLVPIVFIVIISTVIIYGIPAAWVARKLGVAKPVPNGVLILGAHKWSLKIAETIKNEGFKVLVADSNWKNTAKAKSRGLETYQGNILSELALEELDLDGVGRMLSLTPNDEVNSLAALRFGEIFGRSHVFQLAPNTQGHSDNKDVTSHLSGRLLFHDALNFERISKIISQKGSISVQKITDELSFEEFKEQNDNFIIPLFVIASNHVIKPFTVDNPPGTTSGDKVFYVSIEEEMQQELQTADATTLN
ncbi:sodium/proton antiporter, CPA1 family [Fodinibius salinus]|uniref:Sodium/proton antiporter, CPA1 family n=1 Tax=Fodinibius salinus TaxID=860790 RepID=A0A5D3YH20_9BACT|nr:sodium:proton antiporter [Fodinibius salinus]TYP91714.1 sodium/proton antiporter, CPA1 family [Fodinibius salinus]